MIADLTPYPAMKDSGVRWLGDVPKHWEVRRLKQTFCRLVGGSTPSSAEPAFWDGDLVWVTPADISKNSRIRDSLRRITNDGLKSCSSELVPQGSLIVTTRAPVGNVAIAEAHLCTNQGCKALVATPSVVNPVFGFHVLTMLKGELQSLATGTTFTEISTHRLGTVGFPLPPFSEQAAIVRFLDHADRRIRRYIRAKRKLIKLLEEQKQAIIHRAVTRGLDPNVRLKPSGVEWLGDVPEHWEVRAFTRTVIERADYRGATPAKTDSGAFLVTAKNVRRGWIDYDASKEYVAEAEYLRIMRRGLPKMGDLLLTTEAPLGHAALVDREDVALAQRIIRFRLDPEVLHAGFALLSILSPYFQNQLLRRGTGSTAVGIKASKLPQLRSLCPPVHEQRLILSHIETECSPLDAALERSRREISLLLEYGTRLVADVVTGKLDVREAAARLPDEVEEPESLDQADAATDAEEATADDLDAVFAEAVT